MSSATFEPSHDRLGITLFVAFLLHAYIIYAVDFFEQGPDLDSHVTRIEVTLVRTPDTEAPKKADYLGDHDQRGGGTSDLAHPPQIQSPDTSPDDLGLGDMPLSAAPLPNPTSLDMQRIITVDPEEDPLLLDLDKLSDDTPSPDLLAQMVLDTRMEMARIQDELDHLETVEAKRNEDLDLGDAAVLSALEAEYMVGWRERIEAQGNINFPREPRLAGLYGSVDLEFTIRFDGELTHLKVMKSSGHAALDDAMIRLVSQAAPYPPFSAKMRAAGMPDIKVWRRLDYSVESGLTGRAAQN